MVNYEHTFPLKIISKLNNISLLLKILIKRRCLINSEYVNMSLKLKQADLLDPNSFRTQSMRSLINNYLKMNFIFFMQCPRYSHIRSIFSNVQKRCKTFHYLIVTYS